MIPPVGRPIPSNIIAAFGGGAIILLVVGTLFARLDVSLNQMVLVIFGGLLLAAPVISKFSLGKDWLVFETATKISETLDKHNQAIETINASLLRLSQSLEALRENIEAERPGNEPAAGTEYKGIVAKFIGVTPILEENQRIIESGTESLRKVKDLINVLRQNS